MSEPFIVAGCIARDRAWSLPSWHDALCAQTPSPPSAICLLTGDNIDDTDTVLSALVEQHSNTPATQLLVVNNNTGQPGYARGTTVTDDFAHLAEQRNRWIDACLYAWPHLMHLFAVDSDVLPDADVLASLLAVDEPIVGALVRNNGTAPVYDFMHGHDDIGPRRDGTETFIVETLAAPTQCTYVGACVLIRRDVIDAGVRYAPHSRCENVGFAMNATAKGFASWIVPTALTKHIQRNGEVWR